jgi:hypothetical protein
MHDLNAGLGVWPDSVHVSGESHSSPMSQRNADSFPLTMPHPNRRTAVVPAAVPLLDGCPRVSDHGLHTRWEFATL